jgi:hypothetical protein
MDEFTARWINWLGWIANSHCVSRQSVLESPPGGPSQRQLSAPFFGNGRQYGGPHRQAKNDVHDLLQ